MPVWLIPILKSPMARYIGAVLLLVVALWAIHHHGYTSGKTDCQLAQAEALKVAAEKTVKALDDAARRAQEAASAAEANERTARDAVEAARKLPDADRVCVPGAVTKRLRDIR